MPGRTPREALDQGIGGMQAVLSCITQVRLSTRGQKPPRVGAPIEVTLNGLNPPHLRGAHALRLMVACSVRVIATAANDPDIAFDVALVRYSYRLLTRDEVELLAFHWTPDADEESEVTYSHLHIGRALTVGQTVLRPRDLHKAHIPTGVVPLGAVVRMAITEFGVTPLRANWEKILREPADVRTVP